ncbi:MFS transporter [Viridibacillus soli]|uniref:MFS transporter n=1 Tax=Viridibacillus soli TaxID=2798301 RepID=UPI003899D1A8
MVSWWQEWLHSIKSFNRNIKLFMLSNILIQIGMGVFAVMYNLYIRELGMAEAVNGNVIAMTALATAIMLIPAGLLSDRFGRKRALIIGTALTAFTLFYRSIVTVEQPMLWAAFTTGIVWALTQVSGVPFLAENSKASERMKLFSIHFSFMTIASVIGTLLGGVVADGASILLQMSAVEGIRISLYSGVVFFVMGLFPLLRLKMEKKVSVDAAASAKDSLDATEKNASFKGNVKVIILFGLAQLIIGIGSGLVIPYLNLYFANRFDASNTYIGLILALGSAMTAVAMLIGPALVKRVGEVKAIIIFQYLSIPFLFLTAFTSSLFIASIGFLFRQALMNAANPIQSAIAMEIVHDKYKGLANSVNQMVFQVGWASMGLPAAFLVTKFGSYWGYAYTFTITGFLYLIASTYFYMVFGRKKNAA